MPKYQVTAIMSVTLSTVIVAATEEEAITMAQERADNGELQEVEHTGEIHGYAASFLEDFTPPVNMLGETDGNMEDAQ